MKKYLLAILLASASTSLSAQSICFTNGQVNYLYSAEEAGEMMFSGSEITVGARTFSLEEWSKISITDLNAENNTVIVDYSGTSASITVAGNIAQYIDVDVDGAHVSITQSDEVSATTCGEITYILAGESSDGSITLTGNFKSTIELRGLLLTNPGGAAMDIQNGKRIALSAKNGTVNTLIDGTGAQKGALNCKGHLELKGKGTLNIKGNQSHAVYAKEYIEIKNLTLNISGAVKDGINCAQYFLMESGNVNISNTGDDGIQVSYKDDSNREEEDTGCLNIKGGTLDVHITADAAKCIKADGDVIIDGGELTLTTDSDGTWDATKNKTKASACIGADGDAVISAGTLKLSATGSGGKGISCDGVFTCNGGNINIITTGGMLVYSNGSLSHNYTGDAERIDSDYKSSSKGIKADSGVIINDGTLHIITSTNNAEGIESKKDLEINGGNIFVKAYDDGINSANDFKVNGGDLTVISIVGDGLDSNGNLTIAGGYVRTMGSGGMEMGLDAATESGCGVYLTGGTLMAFGGSNTYPTKTGSTQPFVKASVSIKADTEVSVSYAGETLAIFTIPTEYNSSTTSKVMPMAGGGWRPGGSSGFGSLMISLPEMASGRSYTISNDGTTTTATASLTSSGR